MRLDFVTSGAIVMAAIGCGAVFQVRVECGRLDRQADTERALRASMEQRLDEGHRALTQIAVAAESLQGSAKSVPGAAKDLLAAVQDGIATRERQEAASRALLREIGAAGNSAWRTGLPLPALTREYRRLAHSMAKIRLAAAAVPASQAVEKQQRIAGALAAARRELDSAVPPETAAIEQSGREQAASAGRIQILAVAILMAGGTGMVFLWLLGRRLKDQLRNEIAVLEEKFQFNKARTFRIMDWMEAAAATVRRVADELGLLPEPQPAPLVRIAPSPREQDPSKILAENAIHAVRKLQAGTGGIAQAAEQIRHIAFRTNILALNAAIEAAHAGDRGAGFGIVAAEVKNLSAETDACTAEIDVHLRALEERAAGIAATLAQLRHSLRIAELAAPEVPKPVPQRFFEAETSQLLQIAAEMETMAGNPAPVLVSKPPKVTQKPKVRKAAAGGRR
jgi:hypothetical protein